MDQLTGYILSLKLKDCIPKAGTLATNPLKTHYYASVNDSRKENFSYHQVPSLILDISELSTDQ